MSMTEVAYAPGVVQCTTSTTAHGTLVAFLI